MKGSYLLLIELEKESVIKVGKLKKIQFEKGYYIYVGSAQNGLEQRIERHLRKEKKIHWHIDYLLEHAKIKDVFYKENNVREECNIAEKINKKILSVPGFGCSDCDCKSHLFYGSFKKTTNAIEKLNMIPYTKR